MTIGRRGWAVLGSVAPPLCCGAAGLAFAASAGFTRPKELMYGFALFAGAPALGPFSFFGMWAAYRGGSWTWLAAIALLLWTPWLWRTIRVRVPPHPGACLTASFLWCLVGAVLAMPAVRMI
jgi:hypothetical protein